MTDLDLKRAAAELARAGLSIARWSAGTGVAWLRCAACGGEFDVVLSVYMGLESRMRGCPPCSVRQTEQGDEVPERASLGSGRRRTPHARK